MENGAMARIDYKKAYVMVPQSWIIDRLQIYKISDEIMKFIEKTMKNGRVELATGRKGLAEVKFQRSIFQGNALSPLLFVIEMMSLNHILRKYTGGYKLTKSLEKLNHLIYMDDIKLSAKNEKKKLETQIQADRIYSHRT